MLATAVDLAHFGAAHLRPGFFSAAGLGALSTPQRTRADPSGVPPHGSASAGASADASTGVGLGWRVGTDLAGRTVHDHAGTVDEGRAALLVYPAEGVAAVSDARLETQARVTCWLMGRPSPAPSRGKRAVAAAAAPVANHSGANGEAGSPGRAHGA